jgi:hypothetical protein
LFFCLICLVYHHVFPVCPKQHPLSLCSKAGADEIALAARRCSSTCRTQAASARPVVKHAWADESAAIAMQDLSVSHAD